MRIPRVSKETKTRTFVGLILGGFALWMLFGMPPYVMIGALCVCALIAWIEYLRIFAFSPRSFRSLVGIVAIWWAVIDAFRLGSVNIQWIWIFWVMSLIFLVVDSITFERRKQEAKSLSTLLHEYSFYFAGLLYIFFLSAFFSPLLEKSNAPHGKGVILLTFVIVFGGDISAYFYGRKYGRRPLWPQVSPKKTVEGALAGLVGSLICAAIFTIGWHYFKQAPIPFGRICFFTLLAAPLAQGGDFLESFFKRVSGVKDSGQILPGHGGLLDRIDGLAFTLPLAYLVFVQS